MKIIFAGTPELAVPCLQALLQSEHEVVAVYTKPDQPAGRGQKLTASPIKQLALQHQLPVCQPITLRDVTEQEKLRAWQADIMVVIAYGLILPAAVLTTPKFGCINVHVSLLPRWRGAAPIQRALLAGDQETGITIIQMDEGLDTGAMLKKVTCPISSTDTSQTVHNRLADLGASTLLSVLSAIQNGTCKAEIQNSEQACYAKKIEKQEAEIDWKQSAEFIDRQIRAFNPWPIAFTYLDGQPLRIWQAAIVDSIGSAAPGKIISANKTGINVATGKGILSLQKLQLPGGKCLTVTDILNSRAELFEVGKKLGTH